MKSIFRSGIPVMGKNYFPSNIQGLPTWYEIRVTKDGYVARSGKIDIMVAMNAETYSRDVREVASGGYLIYDSTWPRPALLARDDITVLGVPLAKLCNENFNGVRTRILMKNICYAGVLAALLDLDVEQIRTLLAETYAKKPQLVDSNMKAIQLGYDHAKATLPCPLPLRVSALKDAASKTRGHIMIDGNTAAGLGCVYSGATVGAWYPITPSTSLMDAFKSFSDRLRVDPESGRKNFAFIQAEDELAAIGMVLGAAWNGARAFTATSGPGVSLMNEFLGLAYYSEVPAVLFDIQTDQKEGVAQLIRSLNLPVLDETPLITMRPEVSIELAATVRGASSPARSASCGSVALCRSRLATSGSGGSGSSNSSFSSSQWRRTSSTWSSRSGSSRGLASPREAARSAFSAASSPCTRCTSSR